MDGVNQGAEHAPAAGVHYDCARDIKAVISFIERSGAAANAHRDLQGIGRRGWRRSSSAESAHPVSRGHSTWRTRGNHWRRSYGRLSDFGLQSGGLRFKSLCDAFAGEIPILRSKQRGFGYRNLGGLSQGCGPETAPIVVLVLGSHKSRLVESMPDQPEDGRNSCALSIQLS